MIPHQPESRHRQGLAPYIAPVKPRLELEPLVAVISIRERVPRELIPRSRPRTLPSVGPPPPVRTLHPPVLGRPCVEVSEEDAIVGSFRHERHQRRALDETIRSAVLEGGEVTRRHGDAGAVREFDRRGNRRQTVPLGGDDRGRRSSSSSSRIVVVAPRCRRRRRRQPHSHEQVDVAAVGWPRAHRDVSRIAEDIGAERRVRAFLQGDDVGRRRRRESRRGAGGGGGGGGARREGEEEALIADEARRRSRATGGIGRRG